MNYKTAKTYEKYEFDINKAYANDKGRLVVDARCKCDRCNGSGIAISRIENGQPVPYINDNGICYRCQGAGYFHKTIRLYTEEEFERMEKANAKAAEKRASAQEEKMKAEYAKKRREWLSSNGFNDNLTTFVYFSSDSYDIKDQLKDAGFRFDKVLLWHIAEVPEQYKDSCIEISFSEIGDFSAWGAGHFRIGAKDYVANKILSMRPASNSEWIGQEKEKISDLPVTLVSIRGFEGHYGYTQVVKFLNGDNIITWFTATHIPFEPGDELFLSGTIKKLDEYKGDKTTIVTRCRMKEIAK